MFLARFQLRAYLQVLSYLAIAFFLARVLDDTTTTSALAPTRQPPEQSVPDSDSAAEDDAYHFVSINKPEKSMVGFTTYPVAGTEEVLLLNQSGHVVHRWPFDAERVRLLPNCNVLVLHGSKWGLTVDKWRNLKYYAREYDWDGNTVWSHSVDEWAHHDIQKLDNGNYLFLKRETLPYPDYFLPDLENRDDYAIRSDSVIEVTPEGEEIWHWDLHDHFRVDYCGWKGCKKIESANLQKRGSKALDEEGGSGKGPKKMRDWSHTNTATTIPANRWFDQGDTRFKPGNIMIIVRSFWTAYIIDRETGKIVWSYDGDPDPEVPGSGLIRGHDAYMIEQGLPGEGNILIFDNGLAGVRQHSRIIEVNPVTRAIEWEYAAPGKFFSSGAGAAQRLANGNTLISEDKSGRVFEVTTEGEVVWQVEGKYRVSRAQRYEQDHCPRLQDLPPG